MRTCHYPWLPKDSTISPLSEQVLGTVESIVQALPYVVWPEKSEKLLNTSGMSARKERELQKLEGLQSLYNVWLSQELQEAGFEAECPVRDARYATDSQRVDFARMVEDDKRVMLEVEFGYTASIERNFFKLADAYHHGRSAFGVMVLPTLALARTIASGVATYETAVERLSSFHPKTLPVPLLLVGLDHQEARRLDLSESRLPDASCLSGNKGKAVLWHVASELRAGVCVQDIGLPTAIQEREAQAQQKRRLRVLDGQSQLF